jgi:hypothetical protein
MTLVEQLLTWALALLIAACVLLALVLGLSLLFAGEVFVN